MSKRKSEVLGWERIRLNPEKVKRGVAIMRQLFAEDAIKAMSKGAGLPPDWRGRIIR